MNGNETVTIPLLLLKRALGIGIPVSIEALMQLRAEAEHATFGRQNVFSEGNSMSITKEQLEDIGWALALARGWAAIHANDERTEVRLASAEAGLKALVMAEQERAAPKAYADACSDREPGFSSFEDDIKSKDW